MSRPPSLRRSGAVLFTSITLMVIVTVAFYLLQAPPARLNIPWFSVVISLGAVLAPSLIACYWPAAGAPGELPPYRRVSGWLIAGAAFASLPLYVLFALLQVGITELLAFERGTTLVEPLSASTFQAFLWIWLAIAVLPALSEELMYRGLLQSTAVERWGPLWGLLTTAVLFSVIHMDPTGFISRILMGLWFGFLFLRTGSLWASTSAHAFNNTWGVILASWHVLIEANLPWVFGLAVVALAASLICFHQARLWGWPEASGHAKGPGEQPGPELPRFVSMQRPKPPMEG